jgi:resuscitation-promoting factor RpfB
MTPETGKRRLSRLGILLIFLSIIGLLGLGYQFARQHVTVYADGRVTALNTYQGSISQLLAEMGVELLPGDVVSPTTGSDLEDGMEITVQRARVVNVDVDGRLLTRRTQAATIEELFQELDIVISSTDQVIADGVQIWPSADGQMTHQGSLPKEVVINRSVELTVVDGRARQTVATSHDTVGRALDEAGIVLYLGDNVQPSLDTRVQPGLEIVIIRSVAVAVQVDGQTLHTRTHQETVGGLLGELGIGLVGQDYAVPGLADPIKVGSPVKVVRVLEEIVTEQEPIAYETAWQPDPDLEIDNRRVAQQGAPGLLQRRIRVRYEDGHEVSRVLEDEWVAREPAAHIMAYGTLIVPRILDTPDGPVEYWRKIRMLATSYTAATSGKAGDHPSYGVTAVGLPMRKGIVAVDPRLINLYQQVYVAGYGLGTAADTGGAIKGRRIDLGYDDDNLVLWYNWVDVYLLMPPPDPAKIRYLLPD